MRKLVSLAVALLALATASAPVATSGPSATAAVKITRTSFAPSKVTVKAGDSVKWTNTDTRPHQVVADNGTFVSTILSQNQTYTHMFTASGTYRYHDALAPSIAGSIVVTGPPPAVSIGASLPIVVFGEQVHLSGFVSDKLANESVTIYSQPYPQASLAQLTTVVTGAGGAWDLLVKPELLTNYQARWKSNVSQNVQISVRPAISLTHVGSYYSTKVLAGTSHAHSSVYLQRLSRFGQWVTIRKFALGGQSGRVFRLRLPRGLSRLRVYMTINQAGAGYLDGWSRTLSIRRR